MRPEQQRLPADARQAWRALRPDCIAQLHNVVLLQWRMYTAQLPLQGQEKKYHD